MNTLEVGSLVEARWIWLVAFCALMLVINLAWKRTARKRFADEATRPRIFGKSLVPHGVRAVLVLLAMILLVITLIDVRWGLVDRQVPQEGVEIMFVLDVSRSMLAEDVTPNRLDRAKQIIFDMVDEMAGDRVGLTIFAGEARQHIPLTSHYNDFKQRLGEIGPDDLNRGGSHLGLAIEVASQGFLQQSSQQKTMIILSDGEDQASKAVQAATVARDRWGARIFAIGLGDSETGARIPLNRRTSNANPNTRQYVVHEGQQVWSKLDGRLLHQISEQTGGLYVPAGTRRIDAAGLYHDWVAKIPKADFGEARIKRHRARFQWFLLPATLLLIAESFYITGGRTDKT